MSIVHGLLFAALAAAQPQDTVPLYDDLGDHHHAITTSSPRTQQYFDQGLRLIYGFNHAEAIASFREGLRSDPSCAMCWWGIAHAYGPNINLPMDSASGAAAYEAAMNAQRNAAAATPVEQAFIRAIAARYGENPTADRARRDSAFARAMGDAYRAFPADDDLATLYADALMNLAPWVYWTPDLKPRPDTEQLIAALETVMKRNADHAGACHLYIHAVEAAYPKRAEACADRLAGLMPGAGHIVHMPGHIYIRVGRFVDAIRANEHAIHADETFLEDRRPSGVYPLGYYPHNIHFLNFAAIMADRPDLARESARNLAVKATVDLQRTPGVGGWFQHYAQAPAFAALRFERWDDVLALPAPPEDLTYGSGLLHYARGVAHARKGDATAADAELARLRALATVPALKETYILSSNSAATILAIAEATLSGEVAAARRQWDAAARYFRKAIELEDALVYIEPPEWVIPVRHNLGRIQMLAGRPADAQATFEADLVRFPENVWSLRGLAESLEAQGRHAGAREVRARIERALRGSGGTGHGH
jgi:tetratricopeptide (TPR) repeat protein